MKRLRVLVPTVILLLAWASVVQAQTMNQKVVTYLNSKVGVRSGGGECAHAASEALRVAGAQFNTSLIAPDFPAAGDYVWGTLIKKIEYSNNAWSDSSPTAKTQPGDVLQYYNTKLVNSKTASGQVTWIALHHTSIVAEVDSAGMPFRVFEQNASGVRKVLRTAINLRTLKNSTASSVGWVRIYRPVPRVTNKFQFVILNNTAAAKDVSIRLNGAPLGSVPTTATNTAGSYLMMFIDVPPTTTGFTIVLPNGVSIPVANACCYEAYTGTDSRDVWRQLLQ
ncbi:MAG: hypothetical protein AABP62_08885 [Planctomycetota bacterium]